jgi:hypothetical protein
MHLAEVVDLQRAHLAAKEPGTDDLTPSFQAYAQITGSVVPYPTGLDALPIDKQALYWSIVQDQFAPLRIIFGYEGFRSERSLRRGFVRLVARNGHKQGFVGDFLPSLIVCDGNSLVKANGHPYTFPLIEDQWVVIASSAENPLVILINVILTKLSYTFAMPRWFDADLASERLTPLLFAKLGSVNGAEGWMYESYDLSNKQLACIKGEGRNRDWTPTVVSAYQATVLAVLGMMKKLGKSELLALREDHDTAKALTELEQLRVDRIVGLDGEEFTLITLECTTVITAWGEIVAADNSSGRLSAWVEQEEKRRVAAKKGTA